MAPWTRRQQKLLEVGCGPGRFLQFFWESGFDVTGLDASPAMLELARERLEHRADLHLGQAEHLPFRDKEFDVVALLTLLEFCSDPDQVISEALRVARKAILVTFLNRHSLYAVARRSSLRSGKKGFLDKARWFSWWQINSLIWKQAGSRPMHSRSVLIGPQRTWSAKSGWRKLNCRLWPPYLGAYAGVRCDLVGDTPLTPIMAWKEKAKLRPMEQPASSGANRSKPDNHQLL
ncbi:Methyltransferase domain-containing protein [Desulfonatronum thiosulfatophilum]|uniref:Methyltransferase domain-containing protein n=1 Tax=Desulfonatronum thiosulfatophilum TaxID=617002 RepID=A0A1G6BBP8_9BACT|nr:class I SAM-dependent methyltransferase [Desulfonatronum thiosulfatophilum]SDB18010.1 Methyltransferase domain-containing protein [Desulfonatronum thiosulfatophilum]